MFTVTNTFKVPSVTAHYLGSSPLKDRWAWQDMTQALQQQLWLQPKVFCCGLRGVTNPQVSSCISKMTIISVPSSWVLSTTEGHHVKSALNSEGTFKWWINPISWHLLCAILLWGPADGTTIKAGGTVLHPDYNFQGPEEQGSLPRANRVRRTQKTHVVEHLQSPHPPSPQSQV